MFFIRCSVLSPESQYGLQDESTPFRVFLNARTSKRAWPCIPPHSQTICLTSRKTSVIVGGTQWGSIMRWRRQFWMPDISQMSDLIQITKVAPCPSREKHFCQKAKKNDFERFSYCQAHCMQSFIYFTSCSNMFPSHDQENHTVDAWNPIKPINNRISTGEHSRISAINRKGHQQKQHRVMVRTPRCRLWRIC